MCTDTLHFSGHMLRIAGTPAIATQHDLPLASQSCDQCASHLQDDVRHGCQLVNDGEMLFERFVHPLVQIHTSAPFSSYCLHRLCVASYGVFTRSSTAGYVEHPYARWSMHLFLLWQGETHVTPRTVDVFFYGLFMDMGLLQRGLHPSRPQVACLDGYAMVIGNRATLMPNAKARVYGIVTGLIFADIDTLYAEPNTLRRLAR